MVDSSTTQIHNETLWLGRPSGDRHFTNQRHYYSTDKLSTSFVILVSSHCSCLYILCSHRLGPGLICITTQGSWYKKWNHSFIITISHKNHIFDLINFEITLFNHSIMTFQKWYAISRFYVRRPDEGITTKHAGVSSCLWTGKVHVSFDDNCSHRITSYDSKSRLQET